MGLSFLVPSRTVLLVTDDYLYIYKSDSKGVNLVETVPWDTENFDRNVASVISKDCSGRPILILNDMVEQHYRKERVPKGGVSVLDKSSMLKRKLNVAFPSYPVKAAYALKEKEKKTAGRNASDIYIFAAVPDSKQFKQTMSAANTSLASLSGFCLLPVESSDMVQTLSGKLSEKKGFAKSKWVVFMGQQRNGGLRQIVTKSGDLALTRITPISSPEGDVRGWADEVHQEFKATMSYLARFGFQAEEGLDVILIADEDSGHALKTMIEEPCEVYSLTISEAAKKLGISIGAQESDIYTDPLHIGWAGHKGRFILPMKASRIDKVSKPRQAAMAASFLLFLGAAFMSYQLMDAYQNLSLQLSDINDGKSRLAQLKVRLDQELQKKEELGFDVRLVQSSITVRDSFEDQRIKLLPFLQQVGSALGKDLRLDRVIVEKPEEKGLLAKVKFPKKGQKAPERHQFTAKIQMTYPSTTDIDEGNKEVRQLHDRLSALLPDHTVTVTKTLKDYDYVEEVVVETGDLDKKDVAQDFVVELEIEGPLIQ